MSNYQAVYDAVRSQFDMSILVQQASSALLSIEMEWTRPSVIYRPKLSLDGNAWCALYGANLQDGVAGFGKSPNEAMHNFDVAWRREQI